MATDQAAPIVYEKGKLYDISLNELLADPNQPRKIVDAQALDELTASVSKIGVIQPIVFRVDDQGNKVVVVGERRVVAARKADMTTIPAIFITGNYSEIALVENLLRQDLTAIEEAEALQALMEKQKYTQDQLGTIIGKAQSTLSEILSLNKLPQEIRDDCRGDRTISKNTLITIAKKKQARSMIAAYKAYKAKQKKDATTRIKKGLNEPQPMFYHLDKAMTKIRTIDTSAWTDEDRIKFRRSLTSLKTEIDNYLSATSSIIMA